MNIKNLGLLMLLISSLNYILPNQKEDFHKFECAIVHSRSIEKVLSIIEAGNVDINAQNYNGHTPLSYAALIGKTRIVQLLIKHGAQLNIQDKNEETALHLAAKYGRYDIARILLQTGADHHLRNIDGKTALDLAIANKRNSIVKLFLSGSLAKLKYTLVGSIG